MTNWCEIFRTGKHISANGVEKEWTVSDLDTIVAQFNEKKPTAPIVIGHPKTNNPAYGWVDTLKREGKKLFATFKQVNEEFAEWVNKGLYKNRSISLYPDMTLRHVGFLGAVPPAVKGLEEFQFAENDEYIEYSMNVDIVSNSENGADLIVCSDSLQQRKDNTVELEELKKQNADFSEQITEKDNQIKEFSEKISEKDTKIAELEAKIAEEQRTKRLAEHEQFAESLIEKGCITPAQKSYIVDFCEICSTQGSYDFSEGEEKSVLTRFKDFLSGIKQVDFSEKVTGKDANGKDDNTVDFSDGQAIANAIIAKRAEYEKQGVEKSEGEILEELKKGNN